ncbi:hypothetical protein DUI87_34482 [Hirundo rustica rustica]|nr:hypothetical protein DUI87_35183 [Hirundo rustica rustica]RMB89133.1 hypothetical protein DUI87_34482 [Hirundo rustica rustica]
MEVDADEERDEDMEVDGEESGDEEMEVDMEEDEEEAMELDTETDPQQDMEVVEIQKVLHGFPVSFTLHQHAGEHKDEAYSTFCCCFIS